MEDLHLYLAILATLALILVGLLFLKSKSSSNEETQRQKRTRAAIPNRDEDGQILAAGPRGRRGAGPRLRRRQNQDEIEPENVEENADNGQNLSDDENNEAKIPSGKIGKKKMEKLQAKADRKLQLEAEMREREERKKRLEKEEEERKILEEKEKEDERKREEEEQRIREEKERKEHEEYLKLKAAFEVEEEGFDEEESGVENKLETFIQYIKDTKVVLLEDLAAHFKMKTQDAIDRVTTLVEEEKLTGVIDDRGKFIYISQDELEAVAKFITQRGRVSIVELAENSNKLISLQNA